MHKFTIFMPHHLLHQDLNHLYPMLHHHITHQHALSAAFACRDPHCPSHH